MMMNKEDNIPQRPFRRLSGSVAGTSTRLCSLSEDHDIDETSTTLISEDDLTISSTAALASERSKASCDYHEIKAREDPNTKMPTIPIEASTERSHREAILRKRKANVEELWRCMNDRDFEGLKEVFTKDFQVFFRGAELKVIAVMSVDEIIGGCHNLFQAMPDFKFMYREIEESQDSPGALVLHDFVATGKHTGSAFKLGPLPPIEATGKRIVLDPCEHIYYFDPVTHKISREDEIAMGETTGIFGVHTLLSRP